LQILRTEFPRSRPASVWAAAGIVLVGAVMAAAAEDPDEQPWQRPYTGDEATGERVIALWQFTPGAEATDNSGHGHDLTLRGESLFVESGLFGACLESFPAGKDNDKPQGAYAQNHASLNPPGAFTLEMWFKPKPEMDQCDTVFLLDKKYYHYAKDLPKANCGYCLYLRRVGENRREIVAYLGYGEDSAAYTSRAFLAEPGTWQHIAFTYDGAGTGRFFLDGKSAGRTTHEGRGAITPSDYHLVIGDRYGSTHTGFPGYLDQVRISNGCVPFFSGVLEVAVTQGRTVFVRMEKDCRVPLVVTNDTNETLTNGAIRFSLGGSEKEAPLPELAPKETHTIEVPVDTTVRPGTYALQASVAATGSSRKHEAEEDFSIVIVPRRTPHRMPVVMWGGGDLDTLNAIGFTHHLVHLVDYGKVWAAGEPTDATTSGRLDPLAKSLDDHLKQGIGAVVYLYPGRWVIRNEELKQRFQRVDRTGTPYEDANVCATFPEVQAFAYNVGASVAKTFGPFPALDASLVHSEIRDGTNLCFHEHDRQAFREFAGYDIPDEVVGKGGVHYAKIKGFPPDHVVPDDDPTLTFYRWFWKEGDGWNALHTQVHEGLKSTGRADLWTFFDPAVRVPSVWGSGGGVDVISQWTYSYPDPIKIGQATDELMAMANGAAHDQEVMKMTQVIWYRAQTAPDLPEDETKRAPWEKEIPDARFITIAPDHMREAFWSKISRPIRGIMYHGWASLVEGSHGSYRFTNPQTREVLTELIRDVVRPLGPTLLQVPDRQSDVALLESFAAQMFAARGTQGWGGSWEADMHLILQWAHLQPRIVYDETIERDGLDDFRVLVMPCCDVLTQTVAAKIAAFQKEGGLIIADEHLAPALSPDILIPSHKRTKKAGEDKAALQDLAGQLRGELDPFYERYGDSSNPDIVVRFRRYRDTDYVFALNDTRTFGDYVGHHGRVMEKGLPNSATLTVNRTQGYVYDLVAHQAVPATRTADGLSFEAAFGPGGGRLFMITEKRIAGVRVSSPPKTQLGQQVVLEVAVLDDNEQPLSAIIPVQVEILDPEGRPAEFSGYYGAKDGTLTITADLAANDLAGKWTIRATELASGLKKGSGLELQGRSGWIVVPEKADS